MRNTSILTVLLASVFLACSASMVGQAAQSAPSSTNAQQQPQSPNSVSDSDIEMLRENLRAQRKEIMAQNMVLTPDEATKFWPIFDQYRKEAIKPNDARWTLMKEYAANYNTMSDVQANDYIKRADAIDEQLLQLRMKYVPIFEKVVSSKKTALWYQIDRRIDLLINLQLSSVVPMVDARK